MRPVRWAVPWVAVACVLAALSAQAQGGKLRVVRATEGRGAGKDVVTGSLFPSRLLPLGFELGGRLAQSKVSRGDVVKQGQLLGALDSEIVDAQVAQAEAAVEAAEAGAALAADVAARNEKLKAEGGVSDVQFKQTDTQARAAKAQVLQARAGLAQARAGKKRHTLYAPFGGTLVDAPDQTGGMVGPGTPVYVLQQLDPLVLKTTITEGMRAVVKPGLKVRVESVAGDATADDAVVRAVINSADPQSRRIPVEVIVPNKDGRFVANTLARVTFPAGKSQATFVVPATALGTAGGDHVILVDEQGRSRRVPVTVLDRTPREVTVSAPEPLKDVVDYPPASLSDGTQVTQR